MDMPESVQNQICTAGNQNSESFDAIEAAGSIEEIDCNENPKMTKEEFIKELSDSKDVNREVFGLIQASDFHVQFEPFTKVF